MIVDYECNLLQFTIEAQRLKLSFSPFENAFLKKLFPQSKFLVCTSSAEDQIPTVGLRWYTSNDWPHFDPTIEFEAKRKKGWSKHKVERWIEEKSKNYVIDFQSHRIQSELRAWWDFFQILKDKNITNRMGLFVHVYESKIEAESFSFIQSECLTLRKDDMSILLDLKRDYFYHII